MVLREGNVPKIHMPKDLDAGQEPEMGLVMGICPHGSHRELSSPLPSVRSAH